MGGGGSMMGAIISLRNNKSLLKDKRRNSWKNYIGNNIVPTEDHIKATPELLAQIREKFRKERKQKVRENIVFLLFTIISLAILFYVLYIFIWGDYQIDVFKQ